MAGRTEAFTGGLGDGEALPGPGHLVEERVLLDRREHADHGRPGDVPHGHREPHHGAAGVERAEALTNLKEIAEAAVRAGADAIAAINTVRAMAIDAETTMPVLSNSI